MHQSPSSDAAHNGREFPAPPRVHWAVLLLLIACTEALVCYFFPEPYRNFAIYAVAAAWPTYLCIWIRRLNPRASSLYWAIASIVTGYGFLFSWLLGVVVIFELREELLEHYSRREPIGLRLNWFLTIIGSVIYFQFALNKIARPKEAAARALEVESEGSVPA
ncbi:hypothetical protein [Occallatibacter savannae]|uniref:hypothetical protein n=1 Tax=Occallatibacter savannae TaxID=1002691 RepID=UPI0013A52DA8|nr:hypothetical protein [Occallatibacter savannae]